MTAVASSLASLIASRIATFSAPTPPDGVARLARYVELLAHWNRRINLTSLELDPVTDAAIDRLIVEPLLASRWVRSTDRCAVDLGSGGGSPAIPIAIACPALEMTMVESRGKKCAFLREAARELGLRGARVEQARFDEFAARTDAAGLVSIVTVRAVRLDAEFWLITNKIVKTTARLIALSAQIDAAPIDWETLGGAGAHGVSVLERRLPSGLG